MFIPASFKLFNQTIKVIYKRDLIKKKNCFGEWDLNKNKIYLQQSTREHPLTKEQIELTFIHESVHAFHDLSGYSRNEVMVSTLSNLIHQWLEQVTTQ